MERVDVDNTVILVTGSNIVAEDRDRPLAYFLKTEVDKRGDGEFRRAIVVSDLLYLFSEKLQACATVVVGGPRVNILAQMLYREVPLAMVVDQKMFVHMDTSKQRRHALIYGWDYESTHRAARLFVESGELDKFLAAVWSAAEKEEGEEEEEPGEEPEEYDEEWSPGEE